MLSLIKITSIPPGEAPKWVRKEWVGLELPLSDSVNDESIQIGVQGGTPQNLGGYPVDTQIAIDILSKKSEMAAMWWKQNISISLCPQLVFRREVCDLI